MIGLILACAGNHLAAQQPEEPADEAVFELSPFTVNADEAVGYLATQTLSGTRLRSSINDVGSALTIFTEELMDDLAANTINDLVDFAPNSDTYTGTLNDTSGSGNEFLTSASPTYVTRGGATGLISQDFFATPSLPPDRYNAENFTFTRGPNAILFGLGNPAGAFTSTLKRARFRDAYSFEGQVNDEGGWRSTLDVNQVLVQRKLSVRIAGLYEEQEGFRKPDESKSQRAYLTATYKPFNKTTIRVNYEFGDVFRMAVRPWPTYDGIIPWIEAGKPTLPKAGTAGNNVPGIQRAYGTARTLVVTDHSPAGTVVPPAQWKLQGRSANPSFPNYPNLNNFRSLMDDDLFPLEANIQGDSTFRDMDFKAASAFIEQQVTKDLFFEIAVSRVKSDTDVVSGIAGQSILYADVNEQLPDGSPNPNVGMYYVDAFSNILPNLYENETGRFTMSYSFDFKDHWQELGKWLGRHQFALFMESSETDVWGSQNPSQNVTPLPGDPASIINANNRVNFRHYFDPANGIVASNWDPRSSYPVIFAGDPLPEPDPSGVTPAFLAIFGGTSSKTKLATQAVAGQSFFWNDRLVVTYGLREDTQRNYLGNQADFAPYTDEYGIFPNPRLFDAEDYFADSRVQVSGTTKTYGAVFHALPWLSLTYNRSNNFQPNATLRGVDGELLPNPEGDGRDYGLRFAFLGGRVVADVVYYENFSRNRDDNAVANGVHGNFQNTINAIWSTIGSVEGDSKYEDSPYAYYGSVWRDVNTGSSDGVEFNLVANITPQWRLMFNASRRSDGETESRGTILKNYLAETIPLWKANPTWMATELVSGNITGTVADGIADLERTLASFEAISDLPADSLFSPRWSANMVTRYTFAKDSVLDGWFLGGSMNLRGKTIIGFAEDSTGVLVPDEPYYAKSYDLVGAWIGYSTPVFNGKAVLRLQLNVNNLFDSDKVFPQRAVDSRDGESTMAVVRYRLNAPRSFLVTARLQF